MINRDTLIEQPEFKVNVDQIEGTNYKATALGGSAFNVGASGIFETSITGVTAALPVRGVSFQVQINPKVRTIPKLLFTAYAGTDGQAASLWPAGANFDGSNRPHIYLVEDHDRGAFNSGIYQYYIIVENRSGADQDYFFDCRVLVPFAG